MGLKRKSGEMSLTALVHDFEVEFLVEYDLSWVEEPQASELKQLKLKVFDGHGNELTDKLKVSYPSTLAELREQILAKAVEYE